MSGIAYCVTNLPRVAISLAVALICATAQAQINYVISISVDGLRPDAVTALGPSEAPNFYRLRNEGAFTDNARTDYEYTNTLPNHTSMLTGRRVTTAAGHNYTANGEPGSATLHSNKGSYVSSVYDVVHDNGRRTALYSGKTKFVLYSQSYNSTNGALDAIGADNGRKKIDRTIINVDSEALTDSFLVGMDALPYNFSMLHLRDTDDAGHGNAWDVVDLDSPYMDAVRDVDVQLGKVLQLIGTHSLLKNHTALILTADHGGMQGTAGHSDEENPQDYTIPFYVWGPGVPAGADLYALNAGVKLNPGTGRPTYSASIQPIRNGDVANLSLDLLGLNAVPGSTINSSQTFNVFNTFALGDYNYDGDIDNEDYELWARQTGTPFKRASDGNNDGVVDGADYVMWRKLSEAAAGAGGMSSFGAATSGVPEPSAFAMLLIGLSIIAAQRFKRHRHDLSPTLGGEGLGEGGRAVRTLSAITLLLFILANPASAAVYPGNGGTSFAGVLKNGSLTIVDSPDGTINFNFQKGTGNFSRNLVLFIDSVPGGYANNYLMDYSPGSDNQRAISGFNETSKVQSLIQFAPGFAADYAVALWVRAATSGSPSGSLREFIPGTGADAGRVLLDVDNGVNIGVAGSEATGATFHFNASDIGLTPGGGQSFKFIATYLNGSNGIRSNEFIGGVAKSTTVDGNGNLASVTMSDWRTFTLTSGGGGSGGGSLAATPEPAIPAIATGLILTVSLRLRQRRKRSA
jgi:hypothetical protein